MNRLEFLAMCEEMDRVADTVAFALTLDDLEQLSAYTQSQEMLQLGNKMVGYALEGAMYLQSAAACEQLRADAMAWLQLGARYATIVIKVDEHVSMLRAAPAKDQVLERIMRESKI